MVQQIKSIIYTKLSHCYPWLLARSNKITFPSIVRRNNISIRSYHFKTILALNHMDNQIAQQSCAYSNFRFN